MVLEVGTTGAIKPIETHYNGYRFRSRLEARWAVFFDTLGIKYEYEPEGFELGDGTWYLPDFWLPDDECWIEIKPSKLPDEEEMKKCSLLAFQRPVAMFLGTPAVPVISDDWHIISGAYCLMFGTVPARGDVPQHSILDPRPYCWMTRPDETLILWPVPHWEPAPDGQGIFTMFFPDGANMGFYAPFATKSVDSPKLLAAYCAARSARFEHRETP